MNDILIGILSIEVIILDIIVSYALISMVHEKRMWKKILNDEREEWKLLWEGEIGRWIAPRVHEDTDHEKRDSF